MRSDDPAVEELPVCRRPNGAKIVLIVDPNPGEPFSAAGSEVAHLEDSGWRRTRGYGSGISAQGFALLKNIREADDIVQKDQRFYEVHPDVTFCVMNGGAPLKFTKKSWNAWHRLVHHQRNRRVAAQGFGIRAGLVRFFHDALRLIAVGSRKLSMQLHRQAETALIVFNQTHQRSDRGVFDLNAELFSRIAHGPVIAGGIGARKQQLRIRAALLDSLLQRIS